MQRKAPAPTYSKKLLPQRLSELSLKLTHSAFNLLLSTSLGSSDLSPKQRKIVLIHGTHLFGGKSKKVYTRVAMRNKVERKPPGEYQSMVFMVFMKKGEKR